MVAWLVGGCLVGWWLVGGWLVGVCLVAWFLVAWLLGRWLVGGCLVGWLVVARFATWSRPRVARPKTTPACIQLSVLLHPARIQLAVRFVPSMHVLSGPMLIQVYRLSWFRKCF